jgi:uncharacterized protein
VRIAGLLSVIALLFAFACGAARAEANAGLYRAKTIVTGMREETRFPGFATCLTDVLVKVSGDPGLIGDPRVVALSANARALVTGFKYRDRLEGIPIGDEQGTRDRPFDLTVDFFPEKIDAALKELGSTPWTAARPRLAVFLGVDNDGITYVLAGDGKRGIDQRESLDAASWQMGVSVALPGEAGLTAAGLNYEALPMSGLAGLEDMARGIGGDAVLVGSLVWSKGTLGWIANWRLEWQGRSHRWQIRDVNFDDAFRSAMRGTIKIMSGREAAVQ